MTPIVKAFYDRYRFEVANIGMQVFGGHGYIRENGMEQYVRDARIAQIYEGTNGIQALDLVGASCRLIPGAVCVSFSPCQSLSGGEGERCQHAPLF